MLASCFQKFSVKWIPLRAVGLRQRDIPGLVVITPYSFDNISIENIQNHFLRKVRHYMFGFLEGHVTGPELENKIKRYKKRITVSL